MYYCIIIIVLLCIMYYQVQFFQFTIVYYRKQLEVFVGSLQLGLYGVTLFVQDAVQQSWSAAVEHKFTAAPQQKFIIFLQNCILGTRLANQAWIPATWQCDAGNFSH